jgi:iron complex outermembrane receptor protein
MSVRVELFRPRTVVTAVALALGSTFATLTWAQESEGLEEVTITAQKRAERLQDVPVAVTAFSETMIENVGIDRPADFISLTPGVTLNESQNAGNVAINIRGIGQVRNGNPPVAVLYDGVLQVSPNQFNQDLFDIERIEVLKGPQGALYGRNAIGGAMSIVTRQPTNDFEGQVRAGFGSGSEWRVGGSASGALSPDKVQFRVSASHRDFGGVIDNPTLGNEVDGYQDTSFRGLLKFLVSDALTIDLRLAHSKAEGGAVYWVNTPEGQANENEGDPIGNIPGENDRKLTEASVKLDFDMGFATLTSISAYNKVDEVFYGDLDFTPLNILDQFQELNVKAYSQELRLTSGDEGPLRWIAGAYYLDTKRNLTTVAFADFGFFLGNPDGILETALLNTQDDFKIKSWAVFGQADYDITDTFNLSLALRYDEEKTDQTPLRPTRGVTRSVTFDKLQPKLTGTWKFGEDKLAYATYSEGFRGGGLNNSNAPADIRQFDAEVSKNFEIGFKSSYWNNRVTFNAALYTTDFDDQQVFILDISPAALGQLGRNIEKSELKGGELELMVRAASNLDLSLGLSIMDSEITQFDDDPTVVGNSTPQTPDHTINLGVQHTAAVRNGAEFITRVDVRRIGEMAWHVNNVDVRDAVSLANVRFTLKGEQWSVAAYANNLFDKKYTEEYFSRVYSGAGSSLYWPATGRLVGLELGYRF